MIDKNLLSLVLNEEVIHIFDIDNNEFKYNINPNDCTRTINLDTLGRLCKEWCRKESGVEIFVFMLEPKEKCFNIQGLKYDNFEVRVLREKERHLGEYLFSWWNMKSELEAIIQATEWVAKEKGLI